MFKLKKRIVVKYLIFFVRNLLRKKKSSNLKNSIRIGLKKN